MRILLFTFINMTLSLIGCGSSHLEPPPQERKIHPYYFFEGQVFEKGSDQPISFYEPIIYFLDGEGEVVYGDFIDSNGEFKVKLSSETEQKIKFIEFKVPFHKDYRILYEPSSDSLIYMEIYLETDSVEFNRKHDTVWYPHDRNIKLDYREKETQADTAK